MTSRISNYTAAPSMSVLTIPTCCTAECLVSKWGDQEISQCSHLNMQIHPTGGNNHSNTVGQTNIIFHIHKLSACVLKQPMFQSSRWDMMLVFCRGTDSHNNVWTKCMWQQLWVSLCSDMPQGLSSICVPYFNSSWGEISFFQLTLFSNSNSITHDNKYPTKV